MEIQLGFFKHILTDVIENEEKKLDTKMLFNALGIKQINFTTIQLKHSNIFFSQIELLAFGFYFKT